MVLENRKGQTMLVGMMVFIITFIAATMVMPTLFDIVDIARDSSNLNCVAENLTTGTAATCVIVDIFPAFFLGIVVASGASFITSRITGG